MSLPPAPCVEMGWSIREAAKQLGVDEGTWRDWERTGNVPLPRLRTSALILLVTLFVANSFAASPIRGAKRGAAIDGHDPVAYFTKKAAVKGSPEYSYEWAGAKWLFSSAEHRDLFAANPERYAPQYGGYCAYGIASGY